MIGKFSYQTLPQEQPVRMTALDGSQESAWVAASQRGDSLAFNRLVLRWEKAIFNLALRMLQDPDEAALANLETRVGNRITETAQTLEARTDKSLSDLYTTVSLQSERDVGAFNDRLTRVTLNSETRSNQTDVILETLLQAAELRLKQ